MGTRNHKEALCLMTYACVGPASVGGGGFKRETERLMYGCGHREVFWNSRDGVTPFMMQCPSCGGDLQHVNFGGDIYAPNYQPNYGQGVWRDGTPDEAEAIMRKRLEAYPARCEEERQRIEVTIAQAKSGDAHGEFQPGWPMLYRHGMSS